LVSDLSFSGAHGSFDISSNLIIFIFILLLGTAYIIFRSKTFRKRIKNAWADLKLNFKNYRHRPMDVLTSTVCNGVCSATSIFAIYASGHAIGVDLSFAAALLAYTFGNIAANLIPTPGGIGAVEAGVYSGLVLVGISGPDATLITLIYRLITYWLPILPGYYFFWGLRKDLLRDYKPKHNYAA
jgi:uncharacterized membrane protein YbhN (UPF0104 family)